MHFIHLYASIYPLFYVLVRFYLHSLIYLPLDYPTLHLMTNFIHFPFFFFRHTFHNILHTSPIYTNTFPAHIYNALTHNLFDIINQHLIPNNKGIFCFVTCSFLGEFVSVNCHHSRKPFCTIKRTTSGNISLFLFSQPKTAHRTVQMFLSSRYPWYFCDKRHNEQHLSLCTCLFTSCWL